MADHDLLATVGARVRALREKLGMSRRELSKKCGVSERFLAELESGRGNISLVRFAEVSTALGVSPSELLLSWEERRDKSVVALLGVRGAGKSTVGRGVAKRLGIAFVEVDREIEDRAGLSLAEIFDVHGASYYRRVERDVLVEIFKRGEPIVVATGGSIVTHPENYALLSEKAQTVWLKAGAEQHWNRVIEQGDKRPMAENPHAFTELKALLEARAPLYAGANHVVDTSQRSASDVIEDVCRLIGVRPA